MIAKQAGRANSLIAIESCSLHTAPVGVPKAAFYFGDTSILQLFCVRGITPDRNMWKRVHHASC